MLLPLAQAWKPDFRVHAYRIEEKLNVGPLEVRTAAQEGKGCQRLRCKIARSEQGPPENRERHAVSAQPTEEGDRLLHQILNVKHDVLGQILSDPRAIDDGRYSHLGKLGGRANS